VRNGVTRGRECLESGRDLTRPLTLLAYFEPQRSEGLPRRRHQKGCLADAIRRAASPTPSEGRPAGGALIYGVLVLRERYQTSDDQGAVGEGPDVDVIPSLRSPQ
jgi:hypothetical protein